MINVEEIRRLISIYEQTLPGIINTAILCYLKGIRDGIEGDDIDHVYKNIKNLRS